MTAGYTYDGSDLPRVRTGSVSLTSNAEGGTVGTGSLTVDDTPGTQAIVGQKDFAATEDDCANPGTFSGFVTPRTISRKSERQAMAREIDVNFDDLNAMLAFRFVYTHPGMTAQEGGHRHAETLATRAAWLMAHPAVDGLFSDLGRCDFSADIGMDPADYRYQKPGDVLTDMALAAGGYNHYIRDFGDGPELVFRDDNASTADTSDVRVSNVIADVTGDMDGLTFYPWKDATLTRSPGRVISKIAESHANGTVVDERPATASAFNGERGGTASNSNNKTDEAAHRAGVAALWQLHTEEDVIDCTIQVPPSAVNLINQGDRIEARFSHLTTEGYGSMTWFRVTSCTKVSLLKPAGLYNVSLKLSPQEAAQPATDVVQRAFGRGSTNGTLATFANPLTIGNKLLVFVTDSANALPAAPSTTGPLSFWGAGAWTRLNGSSRTAIDSHFNSAPPTAEVYNGVAAYYKTIDATTQTGYVPGTYVTVGAFELTSTANLAGATVVTQDVGTTTADPCVFDAGSLGTVASGELAFFCAIFENNVNAGGSPTGYTGDFIPMTVVAPGDFTERWYHGTYDSNYGPYPASYPQQTWIGDLDGSGASVEASIEKARNERFSFDFGTVGWAAIGIKVST